MTDVSELAAFDKDFVPNAGRRPGLDSLPDGDYDFEILDAELTRTETTSELLLRVGLRVSSTSGVIEYVYFFRNQLSVDILGSDLCTLGFDADQWKPPHRPFSQEIQRVVPLMGAMKLRFRGKKVTTFSKKDPTKAYANLYVNQRIGESQQAKKSAAPTAYNPDADTPDDGGDPIPF